MKQEFAARLNEVLDDHGYPPKGEGRQVALARAFGVSQKGARKWLEAEGMPTTARIAEICQRFCVSRDWLITGMGTRNAAASVADDAGRYVVDCALGRIATAAERRQLAPEDIAALQRLADRVAKA